MEKQDYENHIRYYYPHHFVFYPLILLLISATVILLLRYPDITAVWLSFIIVYLLLGWLSFMMRQHYALNNQNRIVRLEMRLRYYQLTGKRFEELEDHLSFRQIAALRFASDEELPLLAQRAVQEKLRPGEIKRAVKNWKADTMRV